MAVALSSMKNAELLWRYESVMSEAIRWNHQQPPTPASKARAAGLLATAKAITNEMQRRAKVGLGIAPALLAANNGLSDMIVGSVSKTARDFGVIGTAAGEAVGSTIGGAVKASGLGFGLVAVAGVIAAVYLWKK